MTDLKDYPKLFKKMVQDYEKQLVDASNQFQDSVMAAQREMERMVSDSGWAKTIESEDSNTDGSTD